MAIVAEETDRGPGWPAWRRSLWYHFAFYRLTWRASIVGVFLSPVLYLAAMGVGVGKLVSAHSGTVGGLTYLQFVAPALLAVSAMQLGTNESMWPVLAALKWVRTYHAAVATPLAPEDVVAGKLSWVGVRLAGSGAVYAAVIAAFGAVLSWWGILLPAVAVLTGIAFAAPLIAFSATVESDASFTTIFRFLIVPMFLFSATFYPVSVYPPGIRWIVEVMPLYHGVALARASADGTGSLGAIALHVTYLATLAIVGIVVARRNLRRRLVS
jgi:lipooligosaccharide transport system permease protein